MYAVVRSWRRCIRIHEKNTSNLVRIHEAVSTLALARTGTYRRVRRRLSKLLGKFSRRIEEFRPCFEDARPSLAAGFRWACLGGRMKKIRDRMDIELQKLELLLAVVTE